MKNRIAVVIPCYKVKKHILSVIASIGPEVEKIYVVDDRCPENSGQFVAENNSDERVKVVMNEKNLGVGGAVKRGYQEALKEGMEIVVKIDGDGQMNPDDLPDFIQPIVLGHADYTKGNRFFSVEDTAGMPLTRLVGNSVLSIMTKFSTGYWNLFDPTNGYTAIHRSALSLLPLDKISNRYFFESDMMFRLNTIKAVVEDIPMKARYEDEVSNLSVMRSIPEFLKKNVVNFCKRIFYNYFLRDVSAASFELVFGAILLIFGILFGGYHWMASMNTGVAAPTGTVVIPALAIILGMQFLLSFLNYDIEHTPKYPLQLKLAHRKTIK